MKRKIGMVLVLLMLLIVTPFSIITMPVNAQWLDISVPAVVMQGDDLEVYGTAFSFPEGTFFIINVAGPGIDKTATAMVVYGTVVATFDTTYWPEGSYVVTVGDVDAIVSDEASFNIVTVNPTVMATETVKGAIFPIPESLEDEIAEYRSATPVNQYASLLATEDTLFVVFSDEKVEKGLAIVDGLKLPGMTWGGSNLGVIKAESVSVERRGEPTTIDAIKSNPEDYMLKLVKIDATLRQVSFLIDPDDGSDFMMPISVGRIVERPARPMNLINLHEEASEFSINHNRGYINEMIGVTNEGLPVFDFETNYWIDSEAEIDAIVLYPEVVEELIGKSTGNEVENLVISDGEKILLYNVETDLK
ncbi:MAG: hypothetical protein SVK08_06655, partial [Halobacteriota archaeon]|nr:hypothetical protein [Halobacteriota archaeon]